MMNIRMMATIMAALAVIGLSACREAPPVDVPQIRDIPFDQLAEQDAKARLLAERKSLRSLCESDDFAACVKLAGTYPLRDARGEISSVDMERRHALYQRACDGDHTPGCRLLALHWRSRNALGQALPPAQKACDQGDVAGCSLSHRLEYARPATERDAARLAALQAQICTMDPREPCHQLGLDLLEEPGASEAAKGAFETSCAAGLERSCYRAIDLVTAEIENSPDEAMLADYRAKICRLSDGAVCSE